MAMSRGMLARPLVGTASRGATGSLWRQLIALSRLFLRAAETAARVEQAPVQRQRDAALAQWLEDGGDAGT